MVCTIDKEKLLNTPKTLTLEMSLRCNQRCGHCFNNSGPDMGSPDDLTRDELVTVLRDGARAGFRGLQFAGGEPMLNPSLAELIRAAHGLGYHTEVYSNLSVLPPAVLRALVDCKASAATSFYSDRPEVHAQIIGGQELVKNWQGTVANIRRIVEAAIPFRAGVIVMNENRDRIPQTVDFLKGLGVRTIDVAQVQGVGRAAATYPVSDPKDGLCGSCCYGSLTIGPAGDVYPCSIGRYFVVGNVKQASLVEIASGERITGLRQDLFEYFMVKQKGGRRDHGCAVRCMPDIDLDWDKCSPNTHSYRIEAETTEVRYGCECGPGQPPCNPDRCGPRSDARPLETVVQREGTGCGPDVTSFVEKGDGVELRYGCSCAPSDTCVPERGPCNPKSDLRSTDPVLSHTSATVKRRGG